MKIGVTGTRQKLKEDQAKWLHQQIIELGDEIDELHHGDCTGADGFAHLCVEALWKPIHVHPPDVDTWRAFCNGPRTVLYEPKPYLVRNRDIVKAVELLLAVPEGPENNFPRSGTWSTIRYADKRKVETRIYAPWMTQ